MPSDNDFDYSLLCAILDRQSFSWSRICEVFNRMSDLEIRRSWLWTARIICVACAVAAGALAIFLWWQVPNSWRLDVADNASHRFVGITLLGVCLLSFSGVGAFIGALASRRFLNATDFAVLVRAPDIE
jgi:hypothetical protein